LKDTKCTKIKQNKLRHKNDIEKSKLKNKKLFQVFHPVNFLYM